MGEAVHISIWYNQWLHVIFSVNSHQKHFEPQKGSSTHVKYLGDSNSLILQSHAIVQCGDWRNVTVNNEVILSMQSPAPTQSKLPFQSFSSQYACPIIIFCSGVSSQNELVSILSQPKVISYCVTVLDGDQTEPTFKVK